MGTRIGVWLPCRVCGEATEQGICWDCRAAMNAKPKKKAKQ